MGLVWEIDQCPVSTDTKENSKSALNNENPAPAIETLTALQLHQTVGEDTSTGRSKTTKDIEAGVSFSDIEAGIYRKS